MYSQQHAMAPPQKPETFMLSSEAQQSLPQDAQVALQQVDNLKYFLISAPVDWTPDQYIRRFLLPTGEYVSCVLWNNLFHISGTDIVRCLSFRFQAFGRPVKNPKKFEEGIFSDLRNLKAGTDASLEEPKSGFLDFLYKNNCIRTQKKQKVFYWYSVPHDRLFLDALERDLKREKMGQDATTAAVSEPALSFEYDASQSLFEQLTKSQQANSSSFSAQQPSFAASQPPSESTSPVLRALDTMPPPAMMPQTLSDDLTPMSAYGSLSLGGPSPISGPSPVQGPPPAQLKREEYQRFLYNPNGVPLHAQPLHAHMRSGSAPAYGLEYSPAPSFVSSHYDDYGNRGISYEPITPPPQDMALGAEPAYIANQETGLYSAMMPLQHAQLSYPPQRAYQTSYSPPVIEGSPTYKQRRRRSSIPPGMNGVLPTSHPQAVHHPHAVHRPSDLRRSVSHSIGPVADDEDAGGSPPQLTYSGQLAQAGADDSPAMNPLALHAGGYDSKDDLSVHTSPLDHSPAKLNGPGPMRRAHSTSFEGGPYPQKSHSCPIPTCARIFKRLEHLKRHVRTHTQEKPYVCTSCNKAFSRSDNLAQHKRTHERTDGSEPYGFSGEDEVSEGEHDDLSPNSENGYLPTSLSHPYTSSSMPALTMSMAAPSLMIGGESGTEAY